MIRRSSERGPSASAHFRDSLKEYQLTVTGNTSGRFLRNSDAAWDPPDTTRRQPAPDRLQARRGVGAVVPTRNDADLRQPTPSRRTSSSSRGGRLPTWNDV